MSKHAGADSVETKQRILAAAEAEFSACGFQGASLRRICSAAGVTTGALYFFFRNKEDLFQTLLSRVTDPFNRLLEEHYRQERQAPDRHTDDGQEGDFEVSRMMIELYFSNQTIWDILLHHLNDPAVQAFLDHFADVSTEHYLYLLEQAPQKRPVDRFAIHQFVHMQADTMLTLISHDFTKEEMIGHSKTVIRMLRAAFAALLTE